VNCKQKENEDVGLYRRRFEENARSLQNLMRDKWLNEFMRKTKGYEEIEESGLEISDRDNYVNRGFEIFMASEFIYNCDRKRYQSRIDHMNANYSLTHLPYGQRNQYPMTVENASTLLNRHRADNRGTRNNGSNKSKTQASNNETEAEGTNLAQTGGNNNGPRCFVC